MAAYILSASEFECLFTEMLDTAFGHCFPSTVTRFMNAMIDSYNHSEGTYLVDDIIKVSELPLDDFTPVDFIADRLMSTIDAVVDTVGNVATLEYQPDNEVLIVRYALRPSPSDVHRIRDAYHDSQAQGDYHPERIRRAIEELISVEI